MLLYYHISNLETTVTRALLSIRFLYGCSLLSLNEII